MEKFCHHCGKKYAIGQKFCGGCRTNLLSLSSSPPTPAPIANQRITHFTPFTVGDEDVEYVDTIQHLDIRIKGLTFDFVKDKPQTETIGAAMVAGANIPPEQFKREGPYQNVDPKTFQAEFAKEAGTLRPNE